MIWLWLALAFVLLGYLGTALIAWQSIGRRNFFTYGALVCIFFGAAGAVYIAIDTSRTSNQLISKSNQINDLSKQLLTKSDEIAGLNRKIAEKSDEITKLNRQLMSSVIGGDSYCYLFPLLKQGIPSFSLLHHGEYPLYDVTLRIHDLDKSEALQERGHYFENLFDDVIFSSNIGTLAPNSGRILNEVRFQPKQTLRFNIFFSARNGMFMQFMRIQKLGNEWKFAFKITKGMAKKEQTLLEKIDEGYPRNEKGLVQW